MRRVYAITLRLSLGALVLLVGCTRDGVAPADEAKEAAPAESKGGGAGLLKMLRGDDEPPYEFKFTEPPEGPAAPSAEVFGFKLGAVRFADVEATLRQGGHACADTSIRAQMEAKRAQERARIAAAEERGEDAVTAASWLNHKSKRERNPQVRYACEGVDAAALGDRDRVPARGRLLLVFDSAEHPLRHVSFTRSHPDQAAALQDLRDTFEATQARYGPPTSRRGELPTPAEDGAVEFPPASPIEFTWTFADLVIKVHALRFKESSVTVGERVEIPAGVRPDAPAVVAARASSPAG